MANMKIIFYEHGALFKDILILVTVKKLQNLNIIQHMHIAETPYMILKDRFRRTNNILWASNEPKR
jgi:hypothetical protein